VYVRDEKSYQYSRTSRIEEMIYSDVISLIGEVYFALIARQEELTKLIKNIFMEMR
jgi:hypothetical protein